MHNDMGLSQREFFNDHAEQWLDMFYKNEETGKYDRYDDKFARLFDIIGLHEGDTVLDAGCGSGVLVPYILERTGPDSRLYEVDFAEKMIEENKRLHDDARIVFLASSVDSLDIPSDTVDSAICFSCFPHFKRKPESLAEISRILKLGGQLTIGHFGSAEEINDRHKKHESVMHDRLPSEAEMRELLDNVGFSADMFVDESGFYCFRAFNG